MTTVDTSAAAPMTEAAWPRLSSCDRCGRDVLLARHRGAGRPAALEPMPILPLSACGRCRGNGQTHVPTYARFGPRRHIEAGDLVQAMTRGDLTSCPDCFGTGQRGEELTDEHVVMTIAGVMRAERRLVVPWDSAYQRHRCRTDPDAASA